MNEVKVKASGVVIDSWKSVSVARNLDSLSGSFSLTATDRWEATKEAWPLKPGVKVEIYIDKDRVMIGYIDSVKPSVSGTSREMEIEGRDVTSDLIDCSVINKFEFINIGLDQLVKNLITPFGLTVKTETSVGEKFARWTVKQGETVFETLERAARLRGVLLRTNGNGVLLITKPAGVRSTTDIVQGEGGNLYEGSASYDNKDRFSKIIIKGNSSGTDEFYADKVCQVKGEAIDPSIDRYRPLILVADSNVTTATAKKRAEWEVTTRAAKSAVASVSVIGWKKKDGSLWTVGELVRLNAPYLGINQDTMIQRVDFVKGKNGTFTNMSLIRPDAYGEYAEIKKKKDPIDNLGWSSK